MNDQRIRRMYELMTQLLAELEAMQVDIDTEDRYSNKFMVDRRILIRALKNFLKFF